MLTTSCQLDAVAVMTEVIVFAAIMLDSTNDRAA